MKKTYLLLAGVMLFAACNTSSKSSNTQNASSGNTDSSKKTGTTTVEAAPKEATNWTMETDTDKMTSKERYFATVQATNKLDFDAPYDGGSTASIMLRNQNKENEVMLQVDKGQFTCDITDGCLVTVRFDELPAMKFTGSEPSDGSSTMLFISSSKKFITKLKKAKKMLVQAEFYQSGLKTMEFNVDGLKWDH